MYSYQIENIIQFNIVIDLVSIGQSYRSISKIMVSLFVFDTSNIYKSNNIIQRITKVILTTIRTI